MSESFLRRHLGPRPDDVAAMLAEIGLASLGDLVEKTVPEGIRTTSGLTLPEPLSEWEALKRLEALAAKNQLFRSYLGMGYHDTITPPVILRNVLEDPGWYTAYTPYQPEISQGRLYALLVFQTLVQDLTEMPIANASLLDEATAAAEAMTMSHRLAKGDRNRYLVAADCHPQTLAVVRTRAVPLGIEVSVVPPEEMEPTPDVFGVLLQLPATDGRLYDPRPLIERCHAQDALVTVAADLLSLALMASPGSLGADIVVGSAQRFGVPLGYGGPHAAFMATRDDYKRQMPGRVVGVSKDAHGNLALRLALQTREQHIRRQKATSNICTAQVLLAVVAAMYAVWHGPEGIGRIAREVHEHTGRLAAALGGRVVHSGFFDTLRVRVDDEADTIARARERRINLRSYRDGTVGVSLDETVTEADLADLLAIFGVTRAEPAPGIPDALSRKGPILLHPVFSSVRSETDMLRFLHQLKHKDLALDTAMIPLGSCTMKLNATTEMIPVTWRAFGGLHPFAPPDQALGYRQLFSELESWLAEITGFDAVSLQPNAGSQGEYAGLMAILGWQRFRGERQRDVCLVPASAHGTNPASAAMLGLEVVVVATDDRGNIDLDDLRAKAAEHGPRLCAIMVTYPSTHGVFEAGIRELCSIVHEAGGQVYLDGANMNALVGLCKPAELGADVCHINLHKTFCIPHGGGGPGMGPICVRAHLADFLPGHPVVDTARHGLPVSAAPWGSASILPISWAYIAMLGGTGLKRASQVAILNANYIAARLKDHYPVLYTGENGRVAHECILDLRPLKETTGVSVDDVAKRLIDYGFHAPTMSFPVAGTLMVEPTESEGRAELDRFCDAMISIRSEISAIERGEIDAEDNPLKGAPHTAASLLVDPWHHPYSRLEAAYPSEATRAHKYWPPVGRVDNAWGDRNLVCACPIAWPPEE